VKRKALGKGLGALIPERPAGPENRVQMVPPGQIKPGSHQPRSVFPPERLEELAESIRSNGVIQPVVLRPIPTGYELVAGERRWRAARLAGLDRIPAIIRPLTDREAMEISMVENLQRDDLNPMDAARGYKRLMDRFGMTQEDVAQIIGKNRATIANFLRLLKLPQEAAEMLETGELTTGHAKALLSLNRDRDILRFAADTIKNEWSVRQLERMIQKHHAPIREPRPDPLNDPNLASAIDTLRKRFATRIHCTEKRNGSGRIVLEYYNQEDLIRILELLGS